HRKQPLQRSRRTFREGGDRRDQEHHDKREQRQQRRADPVEQRTRVQIDPPQQGEQQARHDEHHRRGASVVAQLGEHPERDGTGDPGTHADSFSRTRDRNASSIVAVAVDRRSSSGESAARMSPSRINNRLSHRDASSITWLEISRATPERAKSAKSDHSSMRSTGSSPTVGSSSTSSGGSPSSATASEARLRCPPESWPTRTSAWLPSPTCSITRSTSCAGAPRTRAKNRTLSVTLRMSYTLGSWV